MGVKPIRLTQPVELSFKPDEQAAKRWAALVFGSELFDQLSEPEMMVLARRGGAVSPVTSYLAIEPGVRPSTEGLDWFGGASGEGIGLGGIGIAGRGLSGGGSSFDHQEYLRARVKEQLDRCGASGRTLRLELETTRAEIVELTRLALDGASDPTTEHCVREGIWALALPRDFSSENASYRVYL